MSKDFCDVCERFVGHGLHMGRGISGEACPPQFEGRGRRLTFNVQVSINSEWDQNKYRHICTACLHDGLARAFGKQNEGETK